MIRTRPPMRRRAAWAAVAGTLVVMACGGDPAATPVPPDPPSLTTVAPAPESESPAPVTVAPTTQPESPSPEPPPPPVEPEEPAEPPEEPESPPAAPLEIQVDADTVWQEVFDALSAAERSCIQSEVGDDLLDSVLELPLMTETDTEEWEVSIFTCLTPDNARTLFLTAMIAGLREEMDIGELSGEEMSCLRDLAADLDVAALVAADYAGEDNFAFAEATGLLIGCLPDLFLATMLADMGVGMAELSEDELSCLRDWMSETDWAAVMALGDDLAALEEFEARLFDLLGCIPEAFGLPDPAPAGPDDHGDSVEEATAVTVGEPVDGGMDHVGDVDYFTFEALEGESYQVEVTLGSLEDSVMVLYDAEGWELAFNDDRDEESLASLISWVALESGSHYVEVTSFDPFVTGSYTLSVTAG